MSHFLRHILVLLGVISGATLLTSCASLGVGWPESAELSIRLTDAPSYAEAEKIRQVAHQDEVLINGNPVDKTKYPHIVRITNGQGYCTASIVGPRTVLSAAHCMDDNGQIAFRAVDGITYRGRCDHHLEYKSNDHDLALCYLDREVSSTINPVGVVSERSARKNQQVQIFGYGCTNPRGGGGNDGVLRTGHSRIVAGQGRDLVLEQPDGAALCFGDSGGPVYTMDGQQIAVNSKGNIRDRSWVSRTDRWALSFMQGWCREHDTNILGVPGCPNGDGPGDDGPGGGSDGGILSCENDQVKVSVEVK